MWRQPLLLVLTARDAGRDRARRTAIATATTAIRAQRNYLVWVEGYTYAMLVQISISLTVTVTAAAGNGNGNSSNGCW